MLFSARNWRHAAKKSVPYIAAITFLTLSPPLLLLSANADTRGAPLPKLKNDAPLAWHETCSVQDGQHELGFA
jgi:hypothetical protein